MARPAPAPPHPKAQPARIRLAEALSHVPRFDGERFAELFAHGTLSVEIYAPDGEDTQTPHERDEIYVIARGDATFHNGTERQQVKAGDLVFVPAGLEHRFETFSDDFAVWVVFFGPPGGEPGRSHHVS